MSSDTNHTDTQPTDTDTDRTAIDLHRGSQQSVVAVDRGPYTVCVLVDDDSKLPADEVERALRAHAADLAAVTAVESGYFDRLPPADESVEQALDGPLRADGAGAYRCALCGRGHPTTGAALACCSERFDDADLVTDGGTTRCGRRTCDDEAAVTYTTIRGAIRTRCDVHALADAVDGVGDSRAESILDAVELEDLLELCDGADGVHAPVTLSRIDGLGPTSAAEIAKAVDESPLPDALDDEYAPDGGLPRHPETITVGTLDEHDRATLRYKPPAMRAVANVLDDRDPMTADEVVAESEHHESTNRHHLGALVREGIAARAPFIPRPQRSVYYIPGDADAERESERLVPDGGEA